MERLWLDSIQTGQGLLGLVAIMKQPDQFASRAEAIRYYMQQLPKLEGSLALKEAEIRRLQSVIAGHRKVIHHYMRECNPHIKPEEWAVVDGLNQRV